MQPLEDTEQTARIRHIKTDAVVPNEICSGAVRLHPAADVDARIFDAPCELDRICQQVEKDLLERRAIRTAGRQVSDVKDYFPVGAVRSERIETLADNLCDIDPDLVRRLAVDRGKRKQRVDELPHVLRVLAHDTDH